MKKTMLYLLFFAVSFSIFQAADTVSQGSRTKKIWQSIKDTNFGIHYAGRKGKALLSGISKIPSNYLNSFKAHKARTGFLTLGVIAITTGLGWNLKDAINMTKNDESIKNNYNRLRAFTKNFFYKNPIDKITGGLNWAKNRFGESKQAATESETFNRLQKEYNEITDENTLRDFIVQKKNYRLILKQIADLDNTENRKNAALKYIAALK